MKASISFVWDEFLVGVDYVVFNGLLFKYHHETSELVYFRNATLWERFVWGWSSRRRSRTWFMD